jgi:hypothetical protein
MVRADVTATLEALIFYGFVGLLLLLRFDARRFGAADHDDEDANGWRDWLRRLSWYVVALALLYLVYRIHPLRLSVLHLQAGSDLGQVVLSGVELAVVGSLLALAYAWLRFRAVRLPPAGRYPAGLLTVVGTALVDEALFRGVILGLLLVNDWPIELAVGFQAVLYVIATGLANRQRPLGIVLILLLLSVLAGGVTIATSGIGAAFVGHALTRLTLFLLTGRAGQFRDVRSELDEAVDASEVTPEGWEVVPDHDQAGGYWP